MDGSDEANCVRTCDHAGAGDWPHHARTLGGKNQMIICPFLGGPNKHMRKRLVSPPILPLSTQSRERAGGDLRGLDTSVLVEINERWPYYSRPFHVVDRTKQFEERSHGESARKKEH